MRPRKILVVDDNKIIQKMYDILLKGFTLIKADDGIEALRRLKDERGIDLILLDINLPRLSGYEVLDKIKAHDSFKRIPVVVVSVENNKDEKGNLLKAGAAAFLHKPINSSELLNLIESLELNNNEN